MDGKSSPWSIFCLNDVWLNRAMLECGKGIDGMCFIPPPNPHELLNGV